MINVVIPAAGTGLRKNSNKPKLLTEFVDKERLYEKQVNAIRRTWHDANIVYIIGFNKDKVEKKLSDIGCKVIVNDEYNKTNVSYSIKLGLDSLEDKSSFIIYGDLFFSDELIKYLPIQSERSYLIKGQHENFHKKSIGIGENKVMDYVFQEKWARAIYINASDSCQFCNTLTDVKNQRKFGHEIINDMMSRNIHFNVIMGSGYVKELDKFKDFNKINDWIKDTHNG